MFALFGMFGFFGLAYLVEVIARFRSHPDPRIPGATSSGRAQYSRTTDVPQPRSVEAQTTDAPPMAYGAVLCTGLCALLGLLSCIPNSSFKTAFVWASLACGIVGLGLALPVRRSWLGKCALMVAACNLILWCALGPALGSAWGRNRPTARAPGEARTAAGLPASRHGLEVVRTGPPFIGEIDEGTVELIALAPHPSEGAAAWRADGSPATEPFPSNGGGSFAAGKVMREFALRVRSRTVPSTPLLNFDPAAGYFAMGSSTNAESADRTSLVHVLTVACPPDAQGVSFTVAVAEGSWQTVHILAKPARESAMAGAQSSDAGDSGRRISNSWKRSAVTSRSPFTTRSIRATKRRSL